MKTIMTPLARPSSITRRTVANSRLASSGSGSVGFFRKNPFRRSMIMIALRSFTMNSSTSMLSQVSATSNVQQLGCFILPFRQIEITGKHDVQRAASVLRTRIGSGNPRSDHGQLPVANVDRVAVLPCDEESLNRSDARAGSHSHFRLALTAISSDVGKA